MLSCIACGQLYSSIDKNGGYPLRCLKNTHTKKDTSLGRLAVLKSKKPLGLPTSKAGSGPGGGGRELSGLPSFTYWSTTLAWIRYSKGKKAEKQETLWYRHVAHCHRTFAMCLYVLYSSDFCIRCFMCFKISFELLRNQGFPPKHCKLRRAPHLFDGLAKRFRLLLPVGHPWQVIITSVFCRWKSCENKGQFMAAV